LFFTKKVLPTARFFTIKTAFGGRKTLNRPSLAQNPERVPNPFGVHLKAVCMATEPFALIIWHLGTTFGVLPR
jgi:hypothetical protein